MRLYIKQKTGLFFLLFSVNAFAQIPERDFKVVDEFVKKTGPLDSLPMGTISNKVTKPFTEKIDKARAIFDWIAYNIDYDVKAARMGNTSKNTTDEVLLYRKAVGTGYATLFQDMCSSAGIRCLTVNGFAKMNTEQIEEKNAEVNHSWAVVQLGQSPDTWYYVDPAWGSGFTDADMKTYTKSFNGGYFFADKTIFNWQHYPDNEAWKLGPAPKSKAGFYDLPVIKGAAYEFGLKSFSPKNGFIKLKSKQPANFSFVFTDDEPSVSVVLLEIGEGKKKKQKEITYSYQNHTLSFSHKFEEENNYPVTIFVNGKPLIVYNVEVQ